MDSISLNCFFTCRFCICLSFKINRPHFLQLNRISLSSPVSAKEIRTSTRDRSSQARPSGSSEAESQPPVLHFADSPEPDPFNFMSSVKRKMQDQNRNGNPVENYASGNPAENLSSVSMALSEGPLSMTSHSSSKKSVEKSGSHSIEKERNKKMNGASQQPPMDQMVRTKNIEELNKYT